MSRVNFKSTYFFFFFFTRSDIELEIEIMTNIARARNRSTEQYEHYGKITDEQNVNNDRQQRGRASAGGRAVRR